MPVPLPDEETPADDLHVLLSNIITLILDEQAAALTVEADARIAADATKVDKNLFKVQQADPGHAPGRVWVSWV